MPSLPPSGNAGSLLTMCLKYCMPCLRHPREQKMGKRLSEFSLIILLEHFLSVHFYHFFFSYLLMGQKWIIHISLEFFLLKIIVNYWAGFSFDHDGITELQGGKGPDKSSRSTAHLLPISSRISILDKYAGTVYINIPTNIISLCIFHSGQLIQWEISLILSHNMYSSNFHPVLLGQTFGVTATGLIIFLQNDPCENWREFIM